MAKTNVADKNDTGTKEDSEYEHIDPDTASKSKKDKYIEQVRGDFRYDLLAHDQYIRDFDAYEAMLISKPYDSVSRKTQNGLSDGRTTTIYDERAARVMGQLPTGVMRAAGKKDGGASAVLDIIRQKYVYPNANAQAPFLEKLRNWQFYSSVYGFMPMYYDWNVTETGYVGPDCWLWHPRNFIPQLGRASVDDMDYCHAITYVGERYLEDLLEEPDDAEWDKDEVKNLLDMIQNKVSKDVSAQRDSLVTRQRQTQAEKGRIMLATRYESGDDGNWVVFAPEYNGVVLRILRNPHKNGYIPFVIKYAKPLFDNFYGLGDFQRAKPLQFASDGLDNFYFAGVKRGLYPPTIINPAGVVKGSITQDPGAIYLETVPNSIREYKTDPVGLSTYQAAKTVMNGAMLNQAGTTDTTQTQAGTNDPGFGKTPEAISKLGERESTRDNQDRFYLESRLEVLIDRMMGLIPTIGTEDIPVDLFVDDFEEISLAGWGDDVKNMLDISESGQSARMTIKPEFFKDLAIRFQLDSTSTSLADKTTQLKNLQGFVTSMSSMQNEMVEMKNQGMTIDWMLIAKLEAQLSDVPQMTKIFRKMTPQESAMWQQQQAAEGKGQQQEERIIDSTNYKDLPPWAQEQWLERQEFKKPPGGDTMSTDQHLKSVDAATKVHSAVQGSPEMAATNTPAVAPTAPADTPPLAVMHQGRQIVDPHIAMAHHNIRSLVDGAV